MFRSDAWLSFLHDRGVDLSSSSVSRLDGGEVNANWKVTDQHGRSWVVRQYRATLDPLEIDCELAAVGALARSGFPTAAPVAAGSSARLWDVVDGRPAALFRYAVGMHPRQRSGGYGSMDLELGRETARLAGRLRVGP